MKNNQSEPNSQGNQTNQEPSEARNFIAANATVVGNVTLGKEATVWFQAVLRGDANFIRVGDRTNIQDGTIIHVDHDAPTIIAEDVTVGHQCMLHGCTIEKGALIGMSSIVLNHAVIGENSLIGAGSLVTQGTVIPPNVLAFGRPAKVIRPLTEEEIAKNQANIAHYVALGADYLQGKYAE
jgi:carbonic anhydrase/acetyltransferase-like protein (isoleucine patch superfamily)